MTFPEFCQHEAEALKPSPFELWAAKVEKIVGFDLDGDQDTDGYSLDFAFAVFKQGVTAERYAAKIRNRGKVAPHHCIGTEFDRACVRCGKATS